MIIYFECSKCGGQLEADLVRETFQIDPCKSCLSDTQSAAFEEGYEKGYDAGEVTNPPE